MNYQVFNLRILFLTQILPYPPNAGPRIKTWNVLRFLIQKGHQVTLLSYIRPEEVQHLHVLEKMLHQVYIVPIRRSRIRDGYYLLSSFISGRPFLVERDRTQEMLALVQDLIRTGNFDVVQADQLTMAQFALDGVRKIPGETRPKLLFDAHNATWMILERMLRTAPFYLKPLVNLELKKIKKYEGDLVRLFDHTLAVTEIDRQALLQVTGEVESQKLSVTPIAVDTNDLFAVDLPRDSLEILTLGTLHYPPNADGIRWFLRDVFPLVRLQVPRARLTIIGKNPPVDFFDLAKPYGQDVKITGYVDDLVPFIKSSALMVVPVLAGGGMRVRILEALSRGIPVVTTPVGLEGIDAVDQRDVLVADSPEAFAAGVIALLQDPDARIRLSMNGRKLAESRYDWKIALQQMDWLYQTKGYEV